MTALPIAGQKQAKILINAGPSAAGWSSIEAAIRCERLFYFQRVYKREIAPGDPAATEPKPAAFPLVRGAIGHVGLAHEYARRNAKRFNLDPESYYTRDEAMTISAESWGMKTQCVDGTTVEEILEEHARPAVTDYFTYRDGERENLPVVGIECLDEMPLPNGKVITQRMDLVTFDNGRYYIYDHKCLAAGTMIETETGPVEISTLVGKTFKTATRVQDGTLQWCSAKAIASKPRPIYEVTAGGLHSRPGENHPFLTKRGYVEAKNLRADDWLATAGHLPERPDAPVSDALIKISAAWLADGSFTNKIVRWDKQDLDCVFSLRDALDELALPYSTRVSKESLHQVSGGEELASALESVGMKRGDCAPTKSIPIGLTALSSRQAALFLAHIWAGGSAACIGTTRSVRLVYGSQSFALAFGISRMLTQIGVASTISASSVLYKGERLPYFYVVIVGKQSKLKFTEAVLSISPRHRANLTSLLLALDAQGKQTGPTRNLVLDGGVFWRQLEVTPTMCGVEPTFDIEVDDPGHNFVADGFVTHNCVSETHMPKLIARYSLSGQFLLMQHLGSRRYGAQFGGVRLNILVCQQGMKLEARFKRFSPEPSPFAMQEFPAVAAARRDRIDALRGQPMSAYLPALNEMICVNNYEGRCSHYQICQWGTQGAQ